MMARFSTLFLLCLALSSAVFVAGDDSADDVVNISAGQDSADDAIDVSQEEDVTQIGGDIEEAVDAEDEEDEYDDDILRPSKFIDTTYIFPDYPEANNLELDSVLTLLVTVKNNAKHAFNITGIAGHFLAPFDRTYHIQNITEKALGSILEGGERATYEYKFMADNRLEPNEFHFEAFVNYHNANQDPFRSVVVSKTLNLVDKPIELTPALVGNYLFTAVLFGAGLYALAGFLGLTAATKKKKGKRSAGANVERGTRAVNADDGFAVPAKKATGPSRPINRRKNRNSAKNRSPKA